LDCREFERLLPRYLAGVLTDADFDRAVAHEAICPRCQRLASEAMPDPATARCDQGLTTAILHRTLGADCRRIESSLAAEIDGPLSPAEAARVAQHLQECDHCASLARGLRELPALYRLIPRLRAGREFTRAVLARTLGPQPGFVEILRRMWRNPAFLWEGAVVCSLIFTPVFGRSVLDGATQLEQQLRIARVGVRLTLAPAAQWQALRQSAARIECEVRETGARLVGSSSGIDDALVPVRAWITNALAPRSHDAAVGRPGAARPAMRNRTRDASRATSNDSTDANNTSQGGTNELLQP
jgi:anti-sigma factor RsiW